MPYYRFNCEGSVEEAPARFVMSTDEGLVHLKVARRSATTLLTMTTDQAMSLSKMLKEEVLGPTPSRPLGRTRLAAHDR